MMFIILPDLLYRHELQGIRLDLADPAGNLSKHNMTKCKRDILVMADNIKKVNTSRSTKNEQSFHTSSPARPGGPCSPAVPRSPCK